MEKLASDPTSGPRILIVDDDRTVRAILRGMLTTAHYIVAEAESGEAALEKIHQFDPQVILLDIIMPGLSGDELINTIKDWRPAVEVIMITSVTTESVWAECKARGAFDVLLKPLSSKAVRAAVERALEQQRSHAAV